MIIVNTWGNIVNFDNLVLLMNKDNALVGVTNTGYEIYIEDFNETGIAEEYVKQIRKAYAIKQTEFIIGG